MRPKKPKEIKDYRKVPRDLSRHLDSCECIPQEIKAKLAPLVQRSLTASGAGRKKRHSTQLSSRPSSVASSTAETPINSICNMCKLTSLNLASSWSLPTSKASMSVRRRMILPLNSLNFMRFMHKIRIAISSRDCLFLLTVMVYSVQSLPNRESCGTSMQREKAKRGATFSGENDENPICTTNFTRDSVESHVLSNPGLYNPNPGLYNPDPTQIFWAEGYLRSLSVRVCTVQYSVQQYSVLYSIVQYCTVQYRYSSTVRYSAVLP